MKQEILIYGAGAIGRGFLAPLFFQAGYDISFVDIDRDLIDDLKKRKNYTTAFTIGGKYDFVEVDVKNAYYVEEDEEGIKRADYVFVCVGPLNCAAVGERLKKAKMIFSFENERDTADIIKEKSNVKNVYFGIPDVIASSTSPKKLLEKDPLCVVSEEGELVLEKGDYKFPDHIKQVSVKELDMHWTCKFYLHNTPHAIAAYLGAQQGAKYLHEAMAIKYIDDIVSKALEDIKKAIVKKRLVNKEIANWYAEKELSRFRNKLLYDPILRVAREPMRKLRPDDRLIGVSRILMEEGIDPEYVCKAIRAALEYNDEELIKLKNKAGVEGVLTTVAKLDKNEELYKKILGIHEISFLDIGLKTAKDAGKIALKNFRKYKTQVIKYKKYFRDIVTQTDIAIEKNIKETIREQYPEHGFIGEETDGALNGKKEYTWIIDPIDGTVNFSNGIPLFCISIALMHKQEIILGIVYNPAFNELFVAEKGKGATLNSQKITVSESDLLSKSTFTVAFAGGGVGNEEYKAYHDMNEASRGVLRTGSAALNLAYSAAGRLTGMWAKKNPLWDVAAGVILVQEAGGKVTDFKGNKYKLGGELLATNKLVHQEALDVLKKIF